MASFLNDQPLQMPIWIDCDIIAVRAGYKDLLDLANDLVAENELMAISTDEGLDKTPEAVCKAFGWAKLRSAIADNPSLKESRYLNAGLVVFLNLEMMRNWQVIATAQQGDLFPDQNALNVLCYRDPNRVTILACLERAWKAAGSRHGG